MRPAARRTGSARTGRIQTSSGRTGGTKALANPLGETGFPKPYNPARRVLCRVFSVAYFQLLFRPGIGLAVTISSALTHPGVPIAKRVLARDARSRAVLLSPRR